MMRAEPEASYTAGRPVGPASGDFTPAGARPGKWRSALLRDLLSIEACFILFLFAGRFKNLPEFRFVPVDMTILFFVMTAGLILWGVLARRLKPLPIDLPDILMVLFCVVCTVSVFWSSYEFRNIDKISRFIAVGATGYFFASILAQDPERRARLVRLMVALSVALLLYYSCYRWIIGIDERALANTGRINGNNYLEYGMHGELLFLACLALAVYGRSKQLVTAIVGAVGALFALTVIGGRGPMLFAVLGIPLIGAMLVLSPRRLGVGITRLFVLVGTLVFMAWMGYATLVAVKGTTGAALQLHTLQRFEMQLSNEMTHSLDVRSEARDLAYRQWLERPLLGWGMGEFRLQHSLEYPHNLLLEILVETGVAGAAFYLALVALGTVACFRMARDDALPWTEATIVLLFVTEMISHMTVQGYLPDDRIYFTFLALVIRWRPVTASRPAPAGARAEYVHALRKPENA